MEPSKAPFAPPPREGPSREELEKALEGSKVDDLKVMATRLVKSHDNLNAMLEDLQAEKKDLEEENAELQQTIDRFMKELQKLNIGADNTVEPQLQEDPVTFVNRMWEKVRPRDTAVVVSEHVGEIKKPVQDEDGEGSPQNGGEKVRQVVDNVANAIGPIWERGLGAWSNFQQRLQQPEPKKPPVKKPKKPKAEAGPDAAESTEVPPAHPPAVEVEPSAAASSQPPVVEVEVEKASSPAASSTAPAASAVAAQEAAPASAAPAKEAEASTEEAAKGATEDQISSTILIEAELTLDDGSVQLLQVRAADRCKEVAKSFIQEHSLKAWFTDPLTKWLKQVEADAEKFPVKISGDLMEIRKKHSRS